MSAITRALNRILTKFLRAVMQREALAPSEVKPQDITRILLVCPRLKVDDVLLATPAFRAIRESFPDSRLTIMTDNRSHTVLQNNKHIDEILPMPPTNLFMAIRRLWDGFDLAIVFNMREHSLISDILAHLSRAKFVLGPQYPAPAGEEVNRFYNLAAPVSSADKHVSEHFLDILQYIDIDTNNLSEYMALTTEEQMRGFAFLQEHDIKPDETILVFHFEICEETESFPVSESVRIAKHFSTKYNAKIIASCSHEDETCLRKFRYGLPFAPIEAIGYDFRALAAILFCADLVICPDSEVMHIAAAIGVPTLSLFGAHDPLKTKPFGRHVIALQGSEGSCATIATELVISTAENILTDFPKSHRLDARGFDISEKAVEEILNTVETVGEQ